MDINAWKKLSPEEAALRDVTGEDYFYGRGLTSISDQIW